MKIAVVDNIKWVQEKIPGKEITKDYIDIIDTQNFNKEEIYELLEIAYKEGYRHFLINLHAIWYHKTNKDTCQAIKYQEQGGIYIYRMLLNIFKDFQQELKVVFFSPITDKKYLLKKYPENYVLNFFNIIESPFNWTDVLDSFDEEYKGIVLNNASENLLSAWALFNKEKIKSGQDSERINTNEKKILFIDDQQSEWNSVFDNIFEKDSITYIKKNGTILNQTDYRLKLNNEWDAYIELSKEHIRNNSPHCVLSDLYLQENHEQTKPYKTLQDIETISGFKVLREIKNEFPYMPYMINTTSNKVWNVEAFKSKGIWAWSVKDNNILLSKEDKIAQYIHFKNNIDKITNDEWTFVVNIWKSLINIEYKVNNEPDKTIFWWYDECKEALLIIKDCLYTLDTIYSQRNMYESDNVTDYEARQCFQIFNNLGGICETLKINYSTRRVMNPNKKTIGMYIYLLRSFFSHGLFYKSAKSIEAVFCVDLLVKILELEIVDFAIQPSIELAEEKEFVKNTNLNFLLQLENYFNNNPNQFKYNPALLSILKSSHKGITNDILSSKYDNSKLNHKVVIDLVNTFITQP